MDDFTKMTIYMVIYKCFKNDRLIDEYPVGYFVSKEEACRFVTEDIKRCENLDKIESTFQITGIDKDPAYKHVYRINKVNVGYTKPGWPITEIETWKE